MSTNPQAAPIVVTKLSGQSADQSPINTMLTVQNQLEVDIFHEMSANVSVEVLEEFTLFPKLPLELRLMVWRHTLPGPRLIAVTLPKASKAGDLYSHNFMPPMALQIHKESRSEAHLFYRPRLTHVSERYKPIQERTSPQILLNDTTDLLYLRPADSNDPTIVEMTSPGRFLMTVETAGLKRIALHFTMHDLYAEHILGYKAMASLLGGFTDADHIYLVHREKPPPGSTWSLDHSALDGKVHASLQAVASPGLRKFRFATWTKK